MKQVEKYAYKIYEKKSFSDAAKALFISQPALSTAISRLEKELGFKIFDRQTSPLTLTPQGEIYIDSLEEIMQSEALMKERIRRLSDMSYGKVSIGGTCLAAYHVLAAVSAEFQKRYPNIEIELDMGGLGKATLIEKIKKRSLDLLVGHRFSPQIYEATPILEERYVIAMPKDYPGAENLLDYAITKDELIQKTYPKEKEIEDMSIFNQIKFLNITRGSTPGIKMQQLLGDYSVTKYSTRNARHSGMQYNMMRFGLGAIMTSDTAVKMFSHYSDDLIFFVPKSEDSKQLLYIARAITQEPTASAINFKNIAIEICKSKDLFK